MSVHSIVDYIDKAGEHRWHIRVGDDIVADSGEGYKNRSDMLNSLFGLFFGSYDESFLTLYSDWHPATDEEQPVLFDELQTDHEHEVVKVGDPPGSDGDQTL